MAASIFRLSTGYIARNSDGKICKIDLAAAPTPLTVSFDGTCFYNSNVNITPTSYSAVWTQSSKTYYGSIRNPTSGYFSGSFYAFSEFSVSLVIGSGSVRWSGSFKLGSYNVSPFAVDAIVVAAIHRNCPANSVNPRGVYTIDSFTTNVPNGNSCNVVFGSTINLS